MKKFSAIFSVFLIIISFLLFKNKLFSSLPLQSNELIAAAPVGPTISDLVLSTNTPEPVKDNLENTLNAAYPQINGRFGIFIKNIKTEESFEYNDHEIFEPASLYKLWVMAAAYKAIENGTLKENDILSQNVAELNNEFQIDPENAELKEGMILSSVNEALNKMITVSDNYSALLLSERIRNSNIQQFLDENGFIQSSLGQPPQSSPYDIGLFFEKLFKGELANQEDSAKMLKVLINQNLNSKIPRYLPEETIIGHKTGELGYFSHDAGIVFSEKGDYIIVIMTESDSPKDAEDKIAEISKTVFDYFEGNNNKI